MGNPVPKAKTSSMEPQQKRSEQTRRAILESVNGLLLEGTYDQTTIQDIVRRAGCSTGAFYGRFTDRNAALLALMEDRFQETEQLLKPCFDEKRITSETLSESIGNIVCVICDHTQKSLPLLRTAAIASMGQIAEDPFLKSAQAFNSWLLASLTRLLRHHQQQIIQPPEQAAQMSLAIMAGLSRDILRHGVHASGTSVKAEDLKLEIHRLVLAYLLFDAS